MAEKTTISDAQLKSELLTLFSKGNTSKTNLYELLRTRYKIEKQRCLKMFDVAILEYQETTQKAHEREIHTKAVEGVKRGLKSRLEYCLEIQKMLDDNETTETIWDFKSGEPITYTRQLTPLERKALYERISKFEGMDAPTKLATTDKDGNDKPAISIQVVSGLPDINEKE